MHVCVRERKPELLKRAKAKSRVVLLLVVAKTGRQDGQKTRRPWAGRYPGPGNNLGRPVDRLNPIDCLHYLGC
ncbi:unnamed protein product [Protopolystoma xenopodis]|uniref:Uncharacterized protein n=1 Tax=Protopolystoma xenopodis TaxID=117903 RepID=A0A3S5FE16_9PLAT|nr:unnamed protein product [Protopolystoma xenopodis]